MLMADTFRGDHSTGVCAVFDTGEKQFTKVAKEAVPGFIFAEDEIFFKTVTDPGHTKNYPKCAKAVFGHNRYATLGAVNARNAHPFTHGHITLAHNGTLRNQSLLPDSNQFEVDSENICYSISKLGFEETLKKLNGAYALIWYDANEQTMNIFRNTEREFHLFETSAGDWYGCSEEKMGDWILTRGKTGKTIKRHFECEPGVQYIFDVSNGCLLKEERKHELPKFSYQGEDWGYGSYWGNYGGGYRYGSKRTTKEDTTRKETSSVKNKTNQEVLEDIEDGLKIGDVIEFQMVRKEVYPLRETHCRIVGWLPNADNYIEIQCHSVLVGEFAKDGFAKARIVSAYITQGIPHIIVRCGDDAKFDSTLEVEPSISSVIEEIEKEEREISYPTMKTMRSGHRWSEEEWHKYRYTDCVGCGDPVTWEMVGDSEIVSGYTLCPCCSNKAVTDVEPEKKEITEDERLYNRYHNRVCPTCGWVHTDSVIRGDMSQSIWNGLRHNCEVHKHWAHKFNRPVLSLTKPKDENFKVVYDGKRISEDLWNKMCKCKYCAQDIPWEIADQVEFVGGIPVCFDCSKN